MTEATLVPPAAARLRRKDLAEMFLRSFFLQALWNFQRGQNPGWLFSIWPALRRLHRDPRERARAASAQLDFFSTHPYMAGLILGVAAGMDEDGAPPERIAAVRRSMSGPLAALGEAFFWGSLRPLSFVLALSLAGLSSSAAIWVVPAVFLALNNVPHFLVRAGGLAAGYRWRAAVAEALGRFHLQRAAQGAALVGMGICLGGLSSLWLHFGSGRAAAGVFAVLALAALRAGMPPASLLYVWIAAAAAYGCLR